MKTINKTTIKIFLLIAIIFAFVSVLVVPSVSATATLTATLSKYEPYPASPGQTVKVWLLIQNVANEDAKNVIVEMQPSYPFSLYDDASGSQTIPLLGGNKDYLIDYTLKVDENAIQGNNELTIKIKYGAGTYIWEQESTFNIFVQSSDATITINSVKTEPAEIEPGQNAKITINVKNNAPSSFTDLNMKLYMYMVSGTTSTDLPFAPIDSTAEKKIYLLNSGESTDFVYNIRTYPDAISKVYKIPFVLTYYDSLGNQKNKSDYIGVVVNSKPDITVMIDKTDLSQQKKIGSLTLKFVNKGLNDIKFLNVKLLKSDEFDFLSTTDTTYIGNLVSDDYQTAEYKIAIKSSENVITIPVQIQYRDANNNLYNTQEAVELNLIDSGRLNEANKTTGTSTWTIIIIVLIIAGIAFWYFKNKNKKNKKGQF